MCNCRKNARLYQELAQTMETLMREHKAYKRQRKAIVDAINELAEHVEEHEAILDEIYTYLASKEDIEREEKRQRSQQGPRRETEKKDRQRCKQCKAKMHRCKRCGR